MHAGRPSRRLAVIGSVAAIGLVLAAACTADGDRRYPDPVAGQAVYDLTDELRPETEAALEERIDAIEARSGAEIVIYMHADPDISEDENLGRAGRLIDEWGVGREGFDDGLAILIARDPDPNESRVSLYGGSGFLAAYANEDALAEVIRSDLVPPARRGDFEGALLGTVEAIDARITPEGQDRLELLRIANAVLGLVGAPVVLLLTLGGAYVRWRREGDDPDLVDSPSILMAGPPAAMTPPLATVVRQGRATGHTINAVLLELASTGRLTFHNLDQVASARSDADPDPLLDPAIDVHPEPSSAPPLAGPQADAWRRLQALVGGRSGRLARERLWKVNDRLGPVRRKLEEEAVRLGWLARLPGPAITGMTVVGVAEAVVGAGAVLLGLVIPLSGATLFGGALILGGLGTIGFGQAMSQRTPAGAYVDAMLTAYRRTLHKTMEQARSMEQVVADPEVRLLADTPDKAVVWGIALGLHDEVAAVLARGLTAAAEETGTPASAYYPAWLGSSPGSAWSGAGGTDAAGGIVRGSGSAFSGSGMPNVGGMLAALGSIGSAPPSSSSSSSGGGFSGGSSSGGGGASGSF